MFRTPTVAMLLAALILPATAATANNRPTEQQAAIAQLRAGSVKTLRQIEERVLPRMAGMRYLGPEYDSGAMVYRLKFLDGPHVVFVDVDARSGAILRRSR